MGKFAGSATVVVPYVHGMLNPGTYAAVQYSGHWCRFVDLDPLDPFGYSRLVRHLWRSQCNVIICEHDVIPTRAQLDAITSCGHDWCSYGYDDNDHHGGPLFGLVRFSGALMARLPMAADKALTVNGDPNRQREWWQVDVHMARDLKIRGVEWREHSPPVHHEHRDAPITP